MIGHNTQHHGGQKPNTSFLIPGVKHSGGGVMIWACFAATVPGHLAVIESTMISSVPQCFLESNVKAATSSITAKDVEQLFQNPYWCSLSTSYLFREESNLFINYFSSIFQVFLGNIDIGL